MQLLYHKYHMCCTFAWHKTKRHIIYLNLLLDSMLKESFYHLHTMF